MAGPIYPPPRGNHFRYVCTLNDVDIYVYTFSHDGAKNILVGRAPQVPGSSEYFTQDALSETTHLSARLKPHKDRLAAIAAMVGVWR